MRVIVYKRLKENINGENRNTDEGFNLFVSSVIPKVTSKNLVANGVHNITNAITLVTLQPSLNDLIEKNQVQPGDKIKYNGKKYEIKTINRQNNGYDNKGSRKYIITL